MSRESATRWLAALLLAVLVLVAWSNGMSGEFTYDDKVEVIGNRAIRTLDQWRAVLAYNASRPVVVLSWALDWRLWGNDPLGYHAVNVVIHILNAALVMLLGEELIRRMNLNHGLMVGFLAASIWALHPMTTEAVTYVTGRSESLCAFFYLATLVQWLRWTREGGGLHYAICLASFLLAAATKEVAATIPLVLILVEWLLPGRHTSPRRIRWGLAPFIAGLVAGAVARKLLYGVFTTDIWLRPLGVQVLTQVEVVVRYLALWLLPRGQSVFHDHPPVTDPWTPGFLLSLALLVGVTGLLLRRRKTRPGLAFAWCWFLVLLIPSSSVIPLKETMAEHRAYLAGWGIVFAVVLTLTTLLRRHHRLAGLLLLSLLPVLGLATHRRNRVWKTEQALWRDATTKNPSSAEAWYGYGDVLRFRQQYDESIAAYQAALGLDETFTDAWNNLGIALAEQGRADEARHTWLTVLKIHPSYCKAHNNLAWLAYRRRRWDEAIAEFHSTLTYCPRDIQAHYGLGNIYYSARRDASLAAQHYQRVLDIDPQFAFADRVSDRLLHLTW